MIKSVSFDPLSYEDEYGLGTEDARRAAKAARDKAWRDMKLEGKDVWRLVLTGQLRKWQGLGVPDGRVRDVFYLYLREETR